MKINVKGNWALYWGGAPLPEGAEAIGTVERSPGDTGALLKLGSGIYVQGNAHSTRMLPQAEVAAALTGRTASPGRPLQGDEPRRMRQLTLTDTEYERLREIGNGNASAGVSKLLAK